MDSSWPTVRDAARAPSAPTEGADALDLGPAGPLTPFDTPCDRCGTFAPLTRKFGPPLCAACVERAIPPLVRDPADLQGLLRGVLALLGSVGWRAALVAVALEVPFVALEAVARDLPFMVNQLYGFLVGTVAEGVALHLAWQATAPGVSPSVGRAVRRVMSRYGSILGTRFLVSLQVVLYTLLLVVPGVLKALSLTLALPLAVTEEVDAGTATSRSEALMSGHRGAAFLAYCVALAPAMLGFLVYACVLASAGVVAAVASGDPSQAESVASEPWYALVGALFGLTMPALLLPFQLVPAVLLAKRVHARVDEPRW
jgi:hypothetical protein